MTMITIADGMMLVVVIIGSELGKIITYSCSSSTFDGKAFFSKKN